MRCIQLLEEAGTDVLSLAGPNGSGKGTFGKLLKKLFGTVMKVVVITTSDEIRKYRDERKHTALGNRVRENIARLKAKSRMGVIVDNLDDDITCEVIDNAICEALKQKPDLIILDGFPRTPLQMEMLVALKKLRVAYLYADRGYVQKKALERVQDCLRRGEEAREDDAPWAVDARYDVFSVDTKGALNVYGQKSGRAIIRIDSRSYLPMKALKLIRELCFDHIKHEGRTLQEHFVALLDDKNSEASKLVREVEFGYETHNHPTKRPQPWRNQRSPQQMAVAA